MSRIHVFTRSILFSWVILFFPLYVQAQEFASDTVCVEVDLPELLRKALGKEPKPKETGSNSLLVVPIIGSNPATGFMVGLGGQYAFKMPETNLYSLISGSLQATTKDQYLFMIKNLISVQKTNY